MKIKSIRKKPKVWLFPSAVEREYVKALVGIADNLALEVDTFCKKCEENYRLQVREDGFTDWLNNALTELLQALSFFTTESQIQQTVSRLLGEANRFNKKQFQQTLKKAYGVDIFTNESWLAEQLKLYELQNINLIKSIPTQLHEKLRYQFVEAVQKGKRWEEVAKEVQALTGAAKKRAELIARDQIGKLNGQLTKLRQEQIGVKSYIWRTSLDERVRKLHIEREGKEFSWDNPPDDGHPGEPIRCRCYAEAVLPDFDELVAQQGTVITSPNSFKNSIASNNQPITQVIDNKNWTPEFKSRMQVLYNRFAKEGIILDQHAIARFGERIGKLNLSESEIIDFIKNKKPNYIDKRNGRLVRVDLTKKLAIIQSAKDGKIITLERVVNISSNWEAI